MKYQTATDKITETKVGKETNVLRADMILFSDAIS